MDYNNNGHLQEICDVKQPVLFEFQSILPDMFENTDAKTIANIHGSFDGKLKDTNDYWKEENISVDYIVLPFSTIQKLLLNDPSSHYYTENNFDLVEESGLAKKLYEIDDFLKPRFTTQTKYDIITGSPNTITPLRYHLNYRYFCMVTSGKLQIKMSPWKSKKYLHTVKDYETFEFRSPINVWKPQKQYTNEMEKLRFLEFDIPVGHILYIPPYWWYSMKFSDDTTVIPITYNTIINITAHAPQWGLYFLQQQNIKKKIAKTLDVNLSEKEGLEDVGDLGENNSREGEQGKIMMENHMKNDHSMSL